MIKVVHVSTFERKGGAAIAAKRLNTGLTREGVQSSMLVAEKETENPDVKLYKGDTFGWLRRRVLWRQLGIYAARYWLTRPTGYGAFSGSRNARTTDLFESISKVDVINLHWIAGFVDLPSFFRKAKAHHKPVVWTLHDMNAFTGGCHYSYDCLNYQARCGFCPQLGSNFENDLSRNNWIVKELIMSSLSTNNLHLVTPSNWLAKAAGRNTLLNRFPITVIPHGLDTTVFNKISKVVARQKLGLPVSRPILLFAAYYLFNRLKGFSYLLEAFNQLNHHSRPILVTVGKSKGKTDIPNHIHLGSLQREKEMAYAYSAADIFVIPSLSDNLPYTVLEAMACGTPVVGFKVGGIPDMVREDETGMLVAVGDTRALREALFTLLDNHSRLQTMSANCRIVAESDYAMEIQARRYIALYEQVLAANEN